MSSKRKEPIATLVTEHANDDKDPSHPPRQKRLKRNAHTKQDSSLGPRALRGGLPVGKRADTLRVLSTVPGLNLVGKDCRELITDYIQLWICMIVFGGHWWLGCGDAVGHQLSELDTNPKSNPGAEWMDMDSLFDPDPHPWHLVPSARIPRTFASCPTPQVIFIPASAGNNPTYMIKVIENQYLFSVHPSTGRIGPLTQIGRPSLKLFAYRIVSTADGSIYMLGGHDQDRYGDMNIVYLWQGGSLSSQASSHMADAGDEKQPEGDEKVYSPHDKPQSPKQQSDRQYNTDWKQSFEGGEWKQVFQMPFAASYFGCCTMGNNIYATASRVGVDETVQCVSLVTDRGRLHATVALPEVSCRGYSYRGVTMVAVDSKLITVYGTCVRGLDISSSSATSIGWRTINDPPVSMAPAPMHHVPAMCFLNRYVVFVGALGPPSRSSGFQDRVVLLLDTTLQPVAEKERRQTKGRKKIQVPDWNMKWSKLPNLNADRIFATLATVPI